MPSFATLDARRSHDYFEALLSLYWTGRDEGEAAGSLHALRIGCPSVGKS